MAHLKDQLAQFRFESVLNNQPYHRRVTLLGSIDSQPALLLVERTAFDDSTTSLSGLVADLQLNSGKIPDSNDVYSWFWASPASPPLNELKLTMIHPCTPVHIAKYTPQVFHAITETPEIYKDFVKPYILEQRDAGRVNWVYNILEGKAEQDKLLCLETGPSGFSASPDMNWDGQNVQALHVLVLSYRRDIWSLRDLTRDHTPWLREVRQNVLRLLKSKYHVEHDRLKLYLHYQPTYYHFHIHVVHVDLDAGVTQAVGKAISLDNIISVLENMAPGKGMADLSLTYTLGESHGLWERVFAPILAGEIVPRSAEYSALTIARPSTQKSS